MANNANFSPFDPFLMKNFQRLSVKGGRGWAPVVESMRAREPGWTSTSKYWPNLVLEVWTKVQPFDQTSASKSTTHSCQQNAHQQQLQHQQLLSWHLHTPSSLNRSQWVSESVSDKVKQAMVVLGSYKKCMLLSSSQEQRLTKEGDNLIWQNQTWIYLKLEQW